MEWKSIETAPRDGTVIDLWVVCHGIGSRQANCKWWSAVDVCDPHTFEWFTYEKVDYGNYFEWVQFDGNPTHWLLVTEPNV